MKRRINEDEWYPMYEVMDLDFYYGTIVDMPEDKIEWVERVKKEFMETQAYLGNLFKKEE